MLRKISAEKKDVSITCIGCNQNFFHSIKVSVEGEEQAFSFSLCDRCATVLAKELLTAALADECVAAPDFPIRRTVEEEPTVEVPEMEKVDFNEIVNSILQGVQSGAIKIPKGE